MLNLNLNLNMNRSRQSNTKMNDLNNTIVSINSNLILISTAEQTVCGNSSAQFFYFFSPSPRPPLQSHQMGRVSRIDQIRQHNRTRERAAKTRFVAALINSRIEGHAQLLEALRKCRLSKPTKAQATGKLGVLAVNGGKPILSKSKKDVVGLPGLFDADLLAELTEEDRFLGPMKCAIISKDVTSFNKLGSYMAHFWNKAAVVSDCVIVDNKLAIPEPPRKVVLARLHRSHPGQEAMM